MTDIVKSKLKERFKLTGRYDKSDKMKSDLEITQSNEYGV